MKETFNKIGKISDEELINLLQSAMRLEDEGHEMSLFIGVAWEIIQMRIENNWDRQLREMGIANQAGIPA